MKIAICGAGRAGTFLHWNVYNSLNDIEIVALIDPNMELCSLKANELKIPNVFSNLQELVDTGIEIDIVSVCTNIASHYPVSKLALENKFNVLVEKPATELNEELSELYDIAEKNDVYFSVVHNHKFYPSFQKMREIVNSKQYGKLLHVDRVMAFDRNSIRMMEEDHWSHSFPGGRLFEANPHNMYLIHGICGDVSLQNLDIDTNNEHFPHTKISGFNASLKNNSTTVNLTMTVNCDKQLNNKHGPSYFILLFENAVFYVDNSKIHMLKNSLLGDLKIHMRKIISSLKSKFIKNDQIGKGSGHYWFIKNFIDAIKNNGQNVVGKDEALFTQISNLHLGNKVDEKLNS